MEHLSQRTDIDTTRIVVFGRSLGGAVGAVLTKNNPDKVSTCLIKRVLVSFLFLPFLMIHYMYMESPRFKFSGFLISLYGLATIFSQVKKFVFLCRIT